MHFGFRAQAAWLGLLLTSSGHAQSTDGLQGLSNNRDPKTMRSLVENAVRETIQAALRPWDLILQPLEGGLYRYRGKGFDAIVLADGSVRYRDKGPVHLSVVQVTTLVGREGLAQRPPPPHAAIALGDLLYQGAQKLFTKNDPHAIERSQFLELTRELREGLSDAKAKQQREHADDELQQKLMRIAYDAERMGSERAQAALFALWDECAEDDLGGLARVRVENFVRDHCAVADPCAFTDAALARLNAKRKSKRAFAPYVADQPAK